MDIAITAAIAAELRAARGASRMTFKSLVAETGISEASLIRYFNGEREVPSGAFVAICTAMHASPGRVLDLAVQRQKND